MEDLRLIQLMTKDIGLYSANYWSETPASRSSIQQNKKQRNDLDNDFLGSDIIQMTIAHCIAVNDEKCIERAE